MNRLHAERRRLFAVDTAPDQGPVPLLDAQGARTRALVIGWGRPADWPTLRTLWEAVQADLGWPAPLIALDGRDTFQLWIALAEPVPAQAAHAMADALAARWLPRGAATAVAARRAVWPCPTPASEGSWEHAPPVPARQGAEASRWSAFVTPDLVGVFGDDPALDIDPGDEAQADVLARCACVTAAAWARACDALGLSAAGSTPSSHAASTPGVDSLPPPAEAAPDPAARSVHASDLDGPHDDPAAFLRAVMNDRAVPLALRIEAARALLPRPTPEPQVR